MSTKADRFTQHTPHKRLIADYMYEINAVVRTMKLENFSDMLADIENYAATLARINNIDSLALIKNASKGKFILSVAEMTPYSKKLFYSAHLAACCNLFRDKTFKETEFNAKEFSSLALRYISDPSQMEHVNQINSLFHTMDGIRTIQLLRFAGLITRPSHEMYQLALGVGSALKDIHYLHALPYLQRHKTPQGDNLEFNIQFLPVKHIIVSDSDPRYKSHFDIFSENDTPPVLAFNLNTEKTFQALNKSSIEKRNFVTLIRIDHNMIPDVGKFLIQLLPFINDDCDFVISIGLGDTLEEFRGRTKLMKSFFDLYTKAGLQPVLFKLHGNGELKKQWSSLRFGSPGASTYQILHCKLDVERLDAFFKIKKSIY